MRRASKIGLGLLLLAVLAAGVGVELLLEHGISARDEPTAAEAFVTRRLRHLAVPQSERDARNPTPATPDALARARAHWADHCASCHGNDGRGKTDIGQNLYPKAPDMTLPDTQSLSDGELFYIIENGVRLTGMPAWGKEETLEDDTETWELVHFIRRLTKITPEELAEMKTLNPKSRREWEEEEAERKFLEGGDAPAPRSSHTEQ